MIQFYNLSDRPRPHITHQEINESLQELHAIERIRVWYLHANWQISRIQQQWLERTLKAEYRFLHIRIQVANPDKTIDNINLHLRNISIGLNAFLQLRGAYHCTAITVQSYHWRLLAQRCYQRERAALIIQ